MKRPRAPIACFRCHRKKVRCDGAHPFCTRCQSTGSSCSYPSSRRSRNTQPHHVDPYIDHLSQLEHQIRQIEVDMNEYRSMLLSSLMTTTMDPTLGNSSTTASAAPNGQHQPHPQEDMLRSHLSKTEQEVQESRTILAQLRLRGEQRIARTKRNQTKEAKQQQQRQQQQHQRSSSSASVSPNNDKKKTTASSSSSRTAPATTTKGRKSESTASTNEVASSSSSSYLGSSIHYESSSATKSANHKPGMKTSSSSTLQHVPTNFLPMDLYGQPPPASPSTSYQNMYHTHHHHQHTSSGGYPMPPPPPPPPQQQPADLYYMTMVGATSTGATGSMNAAAYYDPLMDYPWTTPTDFAAASTTTTTTTTSGLHDSKPVATTSSATNTPTATSSMENEIKTETVQHQESAHYSPSTVAAIEQVTRMAQQMNHPHQQ